MMLYSTLIVTGIQSSVAATHRTHLITFYLDSEDAYLQLVLMFPEMDIAVSPTQIG